MIHADDGTARDASLATDLPDDVDAAHLPDLTPLPGAFEPLPDDAVEGTDSPDGDAAPPSPTRPRWLALALIMGGVLIGSAGGAGVAWKLAVTKSTPVTPLTAAAEAPTPPTAKVVSPPPGTSAAGQAELPRTAPPSSAPASAPSPPMPASPVPPRRADRSAAAIPGQAHAGSTAPAEAGSGVCAVPPGAEAQTAIRRCIEWFSQAERQRTPAAN